MSLYYRKHNKDPVNVDHVTNKSSHKKAKHKHTDHEKPQSVSKLKIQQEIPQ